MGDNTRNSAAPIPTNPGGSTGGTSLTGQYDGGPSWMQTSAPYDPTTLRSYGTTPTTRAGSFIGATPGLAAGYTGDQVQRALRSYQQTGTMPTDPVMARYVQAGIAPDYAGGDFNIHNAQLAAGLTWHGGPEERADFYANNRWNMFSPEQMAKAGYAGARHDARQNGTLDVLPSRRDFMADAGFARGRAAAVAQGLVGAPVPQPGGGGQTPLVSLPGTQIVDGGQGGPGGQAGQGAPNALPLSSILPSGYQRQVSPTQRKGMLQTTGSGTIIPLR